MSAAAVCHLLNKRRYIFFSVVLRVLAVLVTKRHVNLFVSEAGSVAELASSRKEQKYAGFDSRYQYMFVPIAFENLGVPSESTYSSSTRKVRQEIDREFFRQSRDGGLSFSTLFSFNTAL